MNRTLGLTVVPLAVLMTALGCNTAPGGTFVEVKTLDESDVQIDRHDKPVLVEFHKAGCPACMLLQGTMDELSREYGDHVSFVKVDRERGREVRYRIAIYGYPTVLLYVKGAKRANWRNERSIAVYREAIDAALAELAEPASP